MHAYDALPPALRHWVAGAALPWSPVSCKRIWDKARQQGLGPDEAVGKLINAERKMLARDRFSVGP